MKTRHLIFAIGVVPALCLLSALTACTEQNDAVFGNPEDEIDDIPVYISDAPMENATRGAFPVAADYTKYAISSYYPGGLPYMTNIEMTKRDDGTWKKGRAIGFPKSGYLDFIAFMPGYNFTGVTSVNTGEERSLLYTVPPVNAQQTDFTFSSLMNVSKADAKAGLNFQFKHMFSYLRFVTKLTKEGIDVKVHSITLHNLYSTGKFLIDMNKAKKGVWAIDSTQYDNYKFVLPEDHDLVYNKQEYLHITDSMLFVIPQVCNNVWDPAEGAIDNDNHPVYLTMECRISKTEEGETTYIGCTADTWATVYYPITKGTAWWKKAVPFSGNYNVTINFNGGYTATGADFLETATEGGMQMSSAEPVTSTITISAAWEDDDENSDTISM